MFEYQITSKMRISVISSIKVVRAVKNNPMEIRFMRLLQYAIYKLVAA